jgi:hypothetical protein
MDETKPFPWEPRHVKAAALLAADELTDDEIAAEIECSRSAIARWKRHPEFARRIKEIQDDLGEVERRKAIGKRARRVRVLNDQLNRLLQIIEARADCPRRRPSRPGRNPPGVRAGGAGASRPVPPLRLAPGV